jgi:hypothetical protein
VLLALGGLLLSVGALAGPETKDADFGGEIATGLPKSAANANALSSAAEIMAAPQMN